MAQIYILSSTDEYSSDLDIVPRNYWIEFVVGAEWVWAWWQRNSAPVANRIPIIQFVASRFSDCVTPACDRVFVLRILIYICIYVSLTASCTCTVLSKRL